MPGSLADRLSRVVVGCYPPRWKQRYAGELLDVLDQHRAGPRTVLSLAGGALGTHLDPDYRVQLRLMPQLSRDARIAMAVAAAVIVGLPALVILPVIPRVIREGRWQPSTSDSVTAIAFSSDQRIMVSATNGPPWEATTTLWDITDQARPRQLSLFEGGSPATISPDGATVAANAAGGRPSVALWNVTFSPGGTLLAGVTYHGSVLVFRMAGPGGPARVTTRPGILASARFPGGADAPASPCGPGPGCAFPAAYAAGFTPDGHALTVVVDRPDGSQHGGPRHGIHLAGGRLGCPQQPHHHLPQR